jgi:hypothetical protein
MLAPAKEIYRELAQVESSYGRESDPRGRHTGVEARPVRRFRALSPNRIASGTAGALNRDDLLFRERSAKRRCAGDLARATLKGELGLKVGVVALRDRYRSVALEHLDKALDQLAIELAARDPS